VLGEECDAIYINSKAEFVCQSIAIKMGAGQSSPGAGGEPVTIKTSYYTLLGIEREATDDEIKRAYRRKALELHPDRNYGREEDATKVFADIQAAYEVLSDPQERSWYDSHEGAILRGFEGGEDGSVGDQYQYGGIKITTSDDISRFVAGFALKKVDYDNVPDKFFAELKFFLETIGSEESRAAKMEGLADPEYPTFGDRDDSYEDVVKAFYSGWNSFSTAKSYFWVDKWNLTEAPDRRVRRAMEKENRKERDDAIREFNDAVRSLVGFVRKRDPRYKPNFQTDADRQKILRDAAQAQAARSRMENAKNVQLAEDAIPEWAKVKAPEDEEEESEEEIIEEIECVACNKSFKSEKQYEAHERSKKHQKAVHTLKRRMQKDNDLLDLDRTVQSGTISPQDNHDSIREEPVDARDDDSNDVGDVADMLQETSINNDNDHIDEIKGDENESNESNADTEDEEEAALPNTIQPINPLNPESQGPSIPLPENTEPKIGKAAKKRAKRAAKAATGEEPDVRFDCVQCNGSFPSRTRLFQHIKDFGHAAPVSTVKSGKGKKGKR
jgi:DnaJ family protein A protein 5